MLDEAFSSSLQVFQPESSAERAQAAPKRRSADKSQALACQKSSPSFSEQEFPRSELPQLFEWSPPARPRSQQSAPPQASSQLASSKPTAHQHHTRHRRSEETVKDTTPQSSSSSSGGNIAFQPLFEPASTSSDCISSGTFLTPHQGRRLRRRQPPAFIPDSNDEAKLLAPGSSSSPYSDFESVVQFVGEGSRRINLSATRGSCGGSGIREGGIEALMSALGAIGPRLEGRSVQLDCLTPSPHPQLNKTALDSSLSPSVQPFDRRFSPLMSPALSDVSIANGLSPSGFMSPIGLTPLTSPAEKVTQVDLVGPDQLIPCARNPAPAPISARWSDIRDGALPAPSSTGSARGPAGRDTSPLLGITQSDFLQLLASSSPAPSMPLKKLNAVFQPTGGHAVPQPRISSQSFADVLASVGR